VKHHENMTQFRGKCKHYVTIDKLQQASLKLNFSFLIKIQSSTVKLKTLQTHAIKLHPHKVEEEEQNNRK
jgi:hypothetical protein